MRDSSIFINNGGRNRKSATRASAITSAVSKPMPALSSKLDPARTRNPATSTTEVTSSARPTVWKE